MTRLSFSLGSVVLAASLCGCRTQEADPAPNLVLDRPVDAVLACYRVDEDGFVSPTDPSACRANVECGEGDAQLVGFVANSERSELAVFRRCDRDAGVVDLDPEVPGYNLLPVGQLPARVATLEEGCTVVTANVGSCDFSIVDGAGLAAFALPGVEAQSMASLVSTVVPRLSDGTPLAARPGDLVGVPDALSLLGAVEQGPQLTCEDEVETVIATFPACQLVAEIDLNDRRILQSRRFLRAEDGTVEVVDGGTNPACPVECPLQFLGEVPPDRELPEPDGFEPSSLALVQGEGEEAGRASLFVGGVGGDDLFEITIDEGRWAPPEGVARLTLEGARGVHAIRPTPLVPMNEGDLRFLYVVTGDGSTHVVQLLPGDPLGQECETQLDPSLALEAWPACSPVVEGGRRAFADGPGIRGPGGTAIVDWAFFEHGDEPPRNLGGSPFPVDPEDTDVRLPVDRRVVGVGITNLGRILFASLDQYQSAPPFNVVIDPAQLMSVAVPPHSLWPAIDPVQEVPSEEDEFLALREVFPRLEDAEPERTLPGPEESSQMLAPSLRRIDLAYAPPPDAGADVDPRQSEIAEALGVASNADGLGTFSSLEDALAEGDPAFYENPVARVYARDYESWDVGEDWTLEWEGTIPGTQSATGRLTCGTVVDDEAWASALCEPGTPDPSLPPAEQAPALVDEAANFCSNGVLAGDKLVLLGCSNDEDCGLGRRCLQEPNAVSAGSGICVSARVYEEDFELLRAVCRPFIDDPCGSPRREFLITRAFQDRLYLQALDLPARSHLRRRIAAEDEDEADVLTEVTERFTCLPPLPNDEPITCTSDQECADAGLQDVYCAGDGVCRACTGGFPSCLECDIDADCVMQGFEDDAICSEGRCERPCESGDPDCTLAPLPGPRCFAELIDYVVRTRDAFVFVGSQTGFLPDAVTTIPRRYGDLFLEECAVDPSVSSLLTSRVPLPADEEGIDEIDACPDDTPAAGDPNPCRIVTSREEAELSRFHTLSYRGEPVSALRFSNPLLSVVLDLTSLLGLAEGPAASDAFADLPDWSDVTDAVRFRRGRIPAGYRETFATESGFDALSRLVGAVLPMRILEGPGEFEAFVIDAGGSPGFRGQILRLDLDDVETDEPIIDPDFLVR